MYLWTKKSPLNFGSHPNPDTACGTDRLGGGVHSLSAIVCHASYELSTTECL